MILLNYDANRVEHHVIRLHRAAEPQVDLVYYGLRLRLSRRMTFAGARGTRKGYSRFRGRP